VVTCLNYNSNTPPQTCSHALCNLRTSVCDKYYMICQKDKYINMSTSTRTLHERLLFPSCKRNCSEICLDHLLRTQYLKLFYQKYILFNKTLEIYMNQLKHSVCNASNPLQFYQFNFSHVLVFIPECFRLQFHRLVVSVTLDLRLSRKYSHSTYHERHCLHS
jgi:hypothetical protein